MSRLKISLVFALNYLETVNFIISSLRETFVLARVGNRKLFLQYCGRCTYYLRRSWNRAKMPLNGHLRKPKTLLSPTVSLSCFTRQKRRCRRFSYTLSLSPRPLFPPWKQTHFPFQFFLSIFPFVPQRNRERFPCFFLHYCSSAWLTIATMVEANCTCNCVITVGQHRH